MDKSRKLKVATRKTRYENFKNVCKKIVRFPIRICKSVWNWLTGIDVVGMVNLTLLVAIIVLFSGLIINVLNCHQNNKSYLNSNDTVIVKQTKSNVKTSVLKKSDDIERMNAHNFDVSSPVHAKQKTNVKIVNSSKPTVVKKLSVPANDLPRQRLYGDVIIDVHPDSPILSNGTRIDGNLYIQNMRKYTLPCDTKISGHLFIRNVDKLYFCGGFIVNGNIYVNRQSSFGPIPSNARVNGQIIL